jgi:hypothetical protein
MGLGTFRPAGEIIYEDYDPSYNLTKTKKKIYTNGEWVDLTLVRMPTNRLVEEWCREHYGTAKGTIVEGNWQTTFGKIVMTEKMYVHWKLCE